MITKRVLSLFLSGAVFPLLLFSQEIVTAENYLESVSQRYATIRDYEARIAIRSDSTDMTGYLSFLDPSYLRIDFSNPYEQVLVFNGELLSVYIPRLRAVLNQSITPVRRASTPAGGTSLASAQGLTLLRRGYGSAFVTGPEPVPLDDRTRDMVVKLKLTRRLSSEGFREIILSIDPRTLLIRRIEGRTITESLVRFDFTNIRINIGIPAQRFIYDSPPSANIYNNFLFRDND